MSRDDPSIEERLQFVEQISKTKVLRTCYELAQSGVDRSGVYQVDPDGHLVGEKPISVYCNMETGKTRLGKYSSYF
jgi:hypothetical protein